MNLVDRYVYAVISKLPDNQRDEIEKEIRSLIEEMKEGYTDTDEQEVIKKVLSDLGDPSELADNYRDKKRYLIGPKVFNKYIFVLKIVFISIFVGITVASIVEGIVSEDGFISSFASYLSNVVSGLFQGFTWVTLIFAGLEYQGVNLENKEEPWNIDKLPKIPAKKSLIKKTESIIGIIFISIFTLILYFFPNVFGIYFIEDGKETVISIFNLKEWEHVKFIILGVFLIGILREIVKMIYGKWSIKLAIIYTVLSLISLSLLVLFFSNPDIWNAEFGVQVREAFNLDLDYNINMKDVSGVVIKVFILINIIEILSVIYKGVKYND